ncbi:unnamed protein product [Adineta steineri]|uniref:Uncharacterized protein n=1 Tax=Adineta steineri TaxID=433720 RepID=A0A819J644_9BILA|nr:unnamed protein product [Adineta steineri]CAF3925248.1 unnamed protein product [Adineta steineri]
MNNNARDEFSIIEDLPNELFVGIFCYLNGVDTVFAFLSLNNRFQKLLRKYCKVFDFKSSSKLQFDTIFDQYSTKRWKSLQLSNDDQTSGQIEYCFQRYPLSVYFTQLEFLSLLKMKTSDLSILSELSFLTNLTSLKIGFICGEIISMYDLSDLKQLKRLVITSCFNTRWTNKLSQLDTLEYVIMHCCLNPLVLTWPSRLKHLKIVLESAEHNDLLPQSISSLSELTNLEIYQKEQGYTVPNGQQWEQIISLSCPLLKNFKFVFQFPYQSYISNQIEQIIASFSTPFYINEKKWFVRCDIWTRYRASHNNTTNQVVYLILSSPYAEQFDELMRTDDEFCTVEIEVYTLYSYNVYFNRGDDSNHFIDPERLAKSLRNSLNSRLTLDDVELSSQSVSMQTPRFAWFQFMFSLLSRLERSDISMKEMIHTLCAKDIVYQSKDIKEFVETYTADQAIQWCMKKSFYFSHINRILRSKNLNAIFMNRAIIYDIEQCLRLLNSEQQEILNLLSPMKVYHGQASSRQEIEFWKSNIGTIITMNSFLSTSMDEDIAFAFAETFDNEDNDDEATVLKIWLDKEKVPKAIFVYLYHEDCDIDDCEILFSLRTLFRIDKVEYCPIKETWYINMTVVDEDDDQLQQILTPWKTSILQNYDSIPSQNNQLIYVRNLSEDNGAFLAFQLSVDVILRLDRNDFARQEMMAMCRTKFPHDRFVLAKIDEFERRYQSNQDAAKWYTADSFLYRLLNQVLRTEAIDPIFKFRYYIQDLHNQLAVMQDDYLKRLQISNCSTLILYRGQVMAWNDLQDKFRTNIGNLITMSSFLSTTTDRHVARFFSGDGFVENPERDVSVLYEITINIQSFHSVPFAELHDETIFEEEGEVLFSMGAVFRIDDVYEEHKLLWTVKLTLTTEEEEEQWNVLTEHLQEKEETLMIADENKENPVRTIVGITRKRSRSFDEYRYSKRDFLRSKWPDSFRTKMRRYLEHPAFKTIHKEV